MTPSRACVYIHTMAHRTPSPDQIQDLHGCLCLTLRRTTRVVTQRYDAALRPYGLRATQLPILTAVAPGEPIPLARLATFLGMERTTLLRNVRPLVRQGLIAVRREKAGRRDELEATAKGQALLVRVYPAWRELQEQLLSELEDPRLRQTLAELGQSIAAQKAT